MVRVGLMGIMRMSWMACIVPLWVAVHLLWEVISMTMMRMVLTGFMRMLWTAKMACIVPLWVAVHFSWDVSSMIMMRVVLMGVMRMFWMAKMACIVPLWVAVRYVGSEIMIGSRISALRRVWMGWLVAQRVVMIGLMLLICLLVGLVPFFTGMQRMAGCAVLARGLLLIECEFLCMKLFIYHFILGLKKI